MAGYRMSELTLNSLLEKNKNLKISKKGFNPNLKKNKLESSIALDNMINAFGNENEKVEKKSLTQRKKADNNVLKKVKESIIEIEYNANEDIVFFKFVGAKGFSLNEIFRLLEYKKKIIFEYKKIWQKKIRDAVMLFRSEYGKKLYYDNCSLVLYREGKKKIDNDSFQTMFKYIIDALRYENILDEDNPEVVVNITSEQKISKEYVMGIKIIKNKAL